MRAFQALLLGLLALSSFAAAQQPCVTPPPGLVAWWDADELFPDRYGTLLNAVDAADRMDGPPLYAAAALTTQPGRIGNALAFAAALQNSATIVDHDKFDFTDAMSVELWIRGPQQNVTFPPVWVLDKQQVTSFLNTGWSLQGNAVTNRIGLRIGDGTTSNIVLTPTTINVFDNQWHHIAATFDRNPTTSAAHLNIYVDGALEASTTITGPVAPIAANTENIRVGHGFTGQIDEICLYDRALTPGEIASLASGAGKCRPQWPVRVLSQQHISNPSPSPDLFATTFDIDGSRMVVGTALAGAPHTNGAYIYERVGNQWALALQLPNPAFIPQTTLTALHYNVALSGDNIAFGGTGWGAEVYHFDGTTWVSELFVTGGYGYGREVAVHGDTVLIGDLGQASPQVQVWRRNTSGSWLLEGILSAPNANRYAFGYSTAIHSDLAVSGDHLDNTGGAEAGAVHIYRRSGTTWSLVRTITANEMGAPPWQQPTHAQMHFGMSLALDGERLIVGAPGSLYPASTLNGAAYVLDLTGVNAPNDPFIQEGALLPGVPAYGFTSPSWNSSNHGTGADAVDLQGDLAIVGASSQSDPPFGWHSGATPSGTTFVFARQNGTWNLIGKGLPHQWNFAWVSTCARIAGDQVLASSGNFGVFTFDGFGGFNSAAYFRPLGEGCGPVTPGPLLLASDERPALGQTVMLETSNIPSTAVFGALLLNFFRVSNLELTSLGMPGCYQQVSLIGAVPHTLFGMPAVSIGLTIPPGPSWIGKKIFAQSAVLVPGFNQLGVISSNGLELRIGDY